MNYRFSLEPYKGVSTRHTCPNCHRKSCFAKYIDTEKQISFPDYVGRCNHEQKCGYNYTPKMYFDENPMAKERLSEEFVPVSKSRVSLPPAPSFIEPEIMRQSLKLYHTNKLFQFLSFHFGQKATEELMLRYHVETSKHWPGATVFWQVDISGRVRTGKVMLYNSENGRRIKEPHNYITWVHSLLKKENFNLRQCLFGEHLLSSEQQRPVALVESEKSALISSFYLPQYLWIASGGKNGAFNRDTMSVLKNRRVLLFPDLGATDYWDSKMEMIRSLGIEVSLFDFMERNETKDDIQDDKNALPRIIGIEGVWGSGKSNVVKMLEKELAEGYYFFEYDAWGHQEDLQRRSILELLTSKLISDNILSGDTTITIKGGGKKSVTWSKKLKYLLARKTETVTEKYPLISNGMVAAFLVAVLTPIFTFIAYAVKLANTTWWFSLLSIIIASLPVLIALAIGGWAYHKDHNKYGLSYLLAIYQDKVENDICYETLSVDEPTVYEFKTWMKDISDFIKENKKPKLVLVFDNMDRLPAEKVKELWSSIHTFFADSGFENIWAVIPFDETHLACAFGDKSKEETKQLTKYFINKTFPIVYRVAPPVITDYRNVFNKLFVEAFGEESDSTETINRIFRLAHPNANVREIISFINEMVALCQEWGNEISIINIALFCLKKTEILSNPVEQILSGKYLNGIQTIINNDLRTQCEIAALLYGVDIEHAKQIPLTKYIEGCINGEEDHDINQYAESNKLFDVVLDEVVKGMDDTLINKIIHCLHTLSRKNDAILHVWQLIAQRKLKDTLEKQLFPVEYQELLLHLDAENQGHVIAQLYKKIVSFKEFNGGDYFKSLNEIEQFIEEKKLTCDLISLIEPKEVEPKIFIDYIRAANRSNIFIRSNVTAKAYNYYQVKTTSADFDSYLANLLPDKFEYTGIIRTLKDDSNYSFTILLQTIKDCISNKKVDKNNAGGIFTTNRLLSSNKDLPLSVRLDSNYINQLYSEIETNNRNNTESGYYDFVAMQLSLGRSVSLVSDGNIRHVVEVMDYYADHGDMLVNCTRWNIPLLNDVLQYMVNHKLGFRLSLSEILPQYENIKNRIHVTDEAFIEHLAEWNNNLDEHINKHNIKNVIPNASFYNLTTQISNSLTNHINKIAIEALSEINTETLYAQRANYSSDYWLVATNNLLAQISSLPDNLTEFAKKILVDISSGSQSINPLPDLFEKIFGMVDRRKVKSTITNIRNEFCNGKVSINSTKFKFFESWLRLHGNLNDRAGEVLDKIVKPIITDSTCQLLILQNKKFYIDLIHTAGDDAYELKNNLKVIVKQNVSEQFIEFVNTVITNDEVKDAK